MAEQKDDGIEYEEISEDDAVVGRAFKLSLAVFAGLAAVVLLVVWIVRSGDAGPPPTEVRVDAPQVVVEDVSAPPVRFVDVTRQAGIEFVHENGAAGDKLLPETMGGGAAFLDYDRDGDQDLLLVNSCPWPESSSAPAVPTTMRLYANDGQGAFTDVTDEAGLAATFYGMGVAVGDADCDGDLDLFFTAVGPNRFFRNAGGRFEEANAGLAGADDAWSTCATFFDADLDGDLDLYVGNYVRWSREIDIQMDNRLTGVGRAYGPPTSFEGSHPYFYRNDGAGGFTDVTSAAGLQVVNSATGLPSAKTLGVRPIDADQDGDLDLMVANDTVANSFFVNQGDGTFQEESATVGLAYDRNGKATGAMGVDAAWYRSGGLGIAIGNFANEMSSLYVLQEGVSLYLDEAIGEGIGAPSRKYLSFGLIFFDYDLDGRLDLLQANGHLESEISLVQASQTYEQPAQLFWNAGPEQRRTFVEVDPASCGDLSRPVVGRGVACADIDADGDLDVLVTQSGGAPMLLRNEQALGHHWIRLQLQQDGCNPDALGAFIELESGGRLQIREVMPTRGYLTQVELPLTFGLGTAERVDNVRIRWPDGQVQELGPLEADRLHVVRRP